MAENCRELMGKIKKEMTRKDEEIVCLKKQIANLLEENQALKEQIAKMETKSSIQRRSMPAELLNELFAALPFETAFCLLSKMSNVLLARNVRKVFNFVKLVPFLKAMKENKWNAQNSRQNLIILEDQLTATTSFLNIVEIFKKQLLQLATIAIGFVGEEIPLENAVWFGDVNNSIGTGWKGRIWIEGHTAQFSDAKEAFQEGDIVGIRLMHSPENSSLECFVTCYGEMLGKTALPAKFVDVKLFPVARLSFGVDAICANFGKNERAYNPRLAIQS